MKKFGNFFVMSLLMMGYGVQASQSRELSVSLLDQKSRSDVGARGVIVYGTYKNSVGKEAYQPELSERKNARDYRLSADVYQAWLSKHEDANQRKRAAMQALWSWVSGK